MRSISVQVSQRFVYSKVSQGYKTHEIKKAISLLKTAGLIYPVVHTDANGLPLGSEINESYQKYLILDIGLVLRLQNMTLGNAVEISTMILTQSVSDIVNKGTLSEMLVGLEIMHNPNPNMKPNL